MTNRFGLILTCIFILGLTSACSQQDSFFSFPSSNAENSTQSNATAASKASGTGLPSAPIVAPPSLNDRPPEPGKMPQSDTLPNGLPALKPLKGVNVNTLFSESIGDTDRRFDRVENAVLDLRKEFEVMKPAIVRLVAVESDIQSLVEQLETLVNTPPPAPIAPMPVSQPQPQPVETPSGEPTQLTASDSITPTPPESVASAPTSFSPPQGSAQSAGGASVTSIRDGQHSGKIRLVMDITKTGPYSVDLDTSENFLLIELPETAWGTTRSKTYPAKHPLIASYSVEPINDGKGTRLILMLKKPTTILDKAMLKPSSITSNHRLYVDLSL